MTNYLAVLLTRAQARALLGAVDAQTGAHGWDDADAQHWQATQGRVLQRAREAITREMEEAR